MQSGQSVIHTGFRFVIMPKDNCVRESIKIIEILKTNKKKLSQGRVFKFWEMEVADFKARSVFCLVLRTACNS